MNPSRPAPRKDLDDHLDHFGVDGRRLRPDGLRADLEELAIAAFLRTLAAEHGADVIQLLDTGKLIHPVLDVGTDHRRGGFRAQGERTAVAVLEGIHLLGDDVGFRAHAAGEQPGFLKDRRADFLIVVSAEHAARHVLDVVPRGAGRRENVARSFDSSNQVPSSSL